ncbi:ATP-binding protein [Candidatus Contubernalis alkaliaceticus]|uniref:ATP-binding protein n=1 Tax=Candidatus Contubernalis alkaliaceticus TaxID=338645 RepID=UPI001F4C2492|nr:ATP-binding protein [Candidatus Contubernalis alkalaceticus]UNC90634.1 HAMP domain-containing protein [Candidatus Contubernalis alkalaceticus]
MFQSIRSKLTVTYLILIFAVTLIINTFLLNLLEQYYLDYQKEVLTRTGRLVANFSESYLKEGSNYVALSNLAEDFSRQVGARVIIVNNNKIVVGDSVRVEGFIGSLLDRGEIEQAWEEGVGYSIQKSSITSQWVMQVAVPVFSENIPQGAVFVSSSLDPIYEILTDINRILLSTMAIALVFVGILGAIFAKKITKPIYALTAAASQIAQGNLEQQIKVIKKDEVGILTQQFNIMASKLQEMTRRLENTIQEVSTESNKLSTILSNMVDGVFAVDKEGSLILVNPVAEEIFSIKSGEYMGRPLKEVPGPAEIKESFERVWRSKKEETCEVEVEKQLYKLVVSPLLGEKQEFFGSVAVLQNITAEKMLEKKQREFVADVSHELRTPLSSVNIIVKTMLEYDLTREEEKDFLKDMDVEIERLSALVTDILDLTRMDSLKGRRGTQKSDPRQLFEEVLVRMYPRAERNQQELTWEIPGLVPMEMNQDQIERVFINLLDNAIKYTPQGGWIRVEAQDLGDEISVKVKDTGPGIPLEDQVRIFERFYRVDKARSREMGGTGLGLAISYEIITAHGGKIWVESEPGYGSTFVFTLPKVQFSEGSPSE